MTREEIERATWNFLRSKGLSELSTSAVMGNIEAESDFDPTQVESGNSIGFGLCQWSFGRRTQLEAYGTDLPHQFNFLWAELTGGGQGTGADMQWYDKGIYIKHSNFMIGNGTLNELTSAFCFCWERPDPEVAHLARRQASANTYYATYTGTHPTDPINPPPYDPIDPPLNPPLLGEFKLKNKYFYSEEDSLFGRKFITNNTSFTLIKTNGNKATILDGIQQRIINKKNIIK
jgi:hypothetical protein